MQSATSKAGRSEVLYLYKVLLRNIELLEPKFQIHYYNWVRTEILKMRDCYISSQIRDATEFAEKSAHWVLAKHLDDPPESLYAPSTVDPGHFSPDKLRRERPLSRIVHSEEERRKALDNYQSDKDGDDF